MREKREMSDLEIRLRHGGAVVLTCTAGALACAALIPFCVGPFVCQYDHPAGLALMYGGIVLGAAGTVGANYFLDVAQEYRFERDKRRHSERE